MKRHCVKSTNYPGLWRIENSVFPCLKTALFLHGKIGGAVGYVGVYLTGYQMDICHVHSSFGNLGSEILDILPNKQEKAFKVRVMAWVNFVNVNNN